MRNKVSVILFAIITLCIFSTGCDIKDDFMETCYKPYLLRVVISRDADENFNLTPFDPNDVSLMISPQEVVIYVFSEEMIFLGYHRAHAGEIIELPYREYGRIYTVAVGTIGKEPIESLFTSFEAGKKYDKAGLLFELTPITGSPNLSQSPADFMYTSGNFDINPYNDKNLIYDLHLEPRIGAIKIVSHDLEEWVDKFFGESGLQHDEFTYIVSSTYDKYNIDGNLYGTQKSYRPPVLYDKIKSEISTPMFNMMPTNPDSLMTISIYRNGVLVFERQISPRTGKQVVMPRAPYIIHLYFDEPGGGLDITPSEFEDIYIDVKF